MKNRKSFNSVRFEKGSGKNYVVKSVLSKGNADFFVEVYKMTILETKNLKKYYGKGDTQVKALDGVNLSVEDGEFVAIVGTSGSGKSTLLHMLGGLDRPTSGSVTVDGKNIFSLKDEALTIFRRRKIGFVFQSFNLVPVLTVLISCRQPGRMAARVSPVEAVRYTEGSSEKTRVKGRKARKVSPFTMAWANLGRSKGKTVVTVLSLSLAVVLLTVTVNFAGGFDMDKYVSNFTASDFIVANAGKFQTSTLFSAEQAVPQSRH